MPARLLLLLPLLSGLPAAADTLALKDGRFVEGRAIDRTDTGYLIHYRHGDVAVGAALVLRHFKEDKAGAFVPTTAEEKAKHAKGLTPWKGRWVRAAVRERGRKKEIAARQKRMEQMKARRLWRNHATVKTKRISFKHTLPDEVFEEFKNLFETYYVFFTKYWRIRPQADFGHVTINIYHDREYFEQVSGARRGVVGYYAPADRDLHFYYDRENHRYTIDVMFHEGNHMLTHMINKDRWYPWWIGEGMAEYFGASKWDPKTKKMTLGHLQSGRLAVLKAQIAEKKLLKLKDLLEAQRMGAVQYAWTWSFCHFLLHTPAYSKRFKKYFVAIGRDSKIRTVNVFANFRGLPATEARESFMRYLKIRDLDALQKEWYAYIEKALSLDRAKLDWGQAGYIMGLYGEHAKARLYLKKAIDAGSKEAYVHYGYAELKLRQGMPGIAAKYAKKATTYDPLHARAWSVLGQALRRKDETSKEGLRCLELAFEMNPDDQALWFALEAARQAARKKKEADAKKKEGQ